MPYACRMREMRGGAPAAGSAQCPFHNGQLERDIAPAFARFIAFLLAHVVDRPGEDRTHDQGSGRGGPWLSSRLPCALASCPRRATRGPSCGGSATSQAAPIRPARRGTGSRTCCRNAIPLTIFSCLAANCARTPSCTPAAGNPAGASASLSSGRPRRQGSWSGTRGRRRAQARVVVRCHRGVELVTVHPVRWHATRS
jgi:hypothetical protein